MRSAPTITPLRAERGWIAHRPIALYTVISVTAAAAPRPTDRRGPVAEVGIGLVIGLMLVAFMVSFVSLLYTGAQAPFLGVAVGLTLLAATVHTVLGARRSTIPGVVSIPQDAPTAVVAVGLGSLLPAVDTTLAVGTTFVYIATCTLVTGLLMLGLGWFRLGRLVRFAPLPVIGGFLAGTGWLLVAGGAELAGSGYSSRPIHVVSLLAAGLFGVGLLLLLRVRPHVALVPVAVGGAVLLFFVVLALTGTSLSEARSLGLLPVAGESLFTLQPEELARVDWSALGAGIGGIISVPLVATMALLLNVSALDVIRAEDSDLDHELRTVGLANLATAPVGAPAGYQSVSLTSLGYRLGIVSRTVPLAVGAVCLVAAAGGSYLVGLIPVPVVGGLLVFLGLGFITDWVVDRRRQMTVPEFGVMLTIVAVVAAFGLVAAVAWGLLAAAVLFAVAYGRVDPIRNSATGRERRSTVDRTPAEAARLEEAGSAIRVVELHGYLFFGSSHGLVERVREMAEDPDPIEVLILDLHRVQGADATALAAFTKLAHLTRELPCRLILSDVPARLRPGLEQALGQQPGRVVVDDLDHALEVAEAWMLEQVTAAPPTCRDLFGPHLWARVARHMERLEVAAGEVLMELGDDEVGLMAVESGEIVTEIPVDTGWRRVRRSGPGTVVGELSLYRAGGRTARVRTLQPSVLYRLSEEQVEELERSDPATASELHRFLAGVMAERLALGNEVIRSLLG